MEQDKQPSRRMMDMGPRRSMDMGPRRPRTVKPPEADPQPVVRQARPATQAQPVAAPRPMRPQQQPAPLQQRPIGQSRPAPQQRPTGQAVRRPAAARYDEEPQVPAPERSANKGGGWRTALQVLIGLVVIAAVASAIVVLYIRYYQ